VLLRDTQMHAYRQQVMHVDFQRVDLTHELHTKVPLHFVNAEAAPGVKMQGGVVSHVMNELDIKCLPSALPEFLEVDLSGLSVGQSVHMSQINLPAGVEVITHGTDPVSRRSRCRVARSPTDAAAAAKQRSKPPRCPGTVRKPCPGSWSGWAIPARNIPKPGTTPGFGFVSSWPASWASSSTAKRASTESVGSSRADGRLAVAAADLHEPFRPVGRCAGPFPSHRASGNTGGA
jgi:hypothetical protein